MSYRDVLEEGCRDGVGRISLVHVVLHHQALVELGLVIRLVLVRCAQHKALSGNAHCSQVFAFTRWLDIVIYNMPRLQRQGRKT